MKLSLGEQETVIRWTRDKGERVVLWTADAYQCRRWKRLGYEVRQDGVGWRCEGPWGCVRVRRVVGGELVRRGGRVPVVGKGA